VELAMNSILGQMTNALARGERIEIRDLGSFDLRHRPARIARNRKTGEDVNLPAKIAVHFKPGKEIRLRVEWIQRVTNAASRNEGLTSLAVK